MSWASFFLITDRRFDNDLITTSAATCGHRIIYCLQYVRLSVAERRQALEADMTILTRQTLVTITGIFSYWPIISHRIVIAVSCTNETCALKFLDYSRHYRRNCSPIAFSICHTMIHCNRHEYFILKLLSSASDWAHIIARSEETSIVISFIDL